MYFVRRSFFNAVADAAAVVKSVVVCSLNVYECIFKSCTHNKHGCLPTVFFVCTRTGSKCEHGQRNFAIQIYAHMSYLYNLLEICRTFGMIPSFIIHLNRNNHGYEYALYLRQYSTTLFSVEQQHIESIRTCRNE